MMKAKLKLPKPQAKLLYRLTPVSLAYGNTSTTTGDPTTTISVTTTHLLRK